MRFLRRVLPMIAAVAVVAPVAACSSTASPDDTAKQFLATFAGGDTAGAAKLTDSPDEARALMDKVRGGLKPTTVMAEEHSVDHPDGASTATAHFSITWQLGTDRSWTYDNQFELREADGDWKVHWAPTVLHPKLAAQQTIAVRDDSAALAPVLDRNAEPLMQPGKVVSVVLDPAKAGDVASIAAKLAGALGGLDPTITQQAIVDGAAKTPAGQPYQVANLRDADYQSVKPQIYDLPGVRFTAAERLLPEDKKFAPQLMPGLRKLVEAQVAGKAGWRVVTVDPNGTEVQDLFGKAAETAQAVHATLDKATQNAAQSAIAGEQNPSMVVAIQPSTGEILAVAQNAAADAQGAIALTGRYPPGSTFKIVTAAAAIESGKAAGDTPSPCPATLTVDGRPIPNDPHVGDHGTIPLHQAFAFSCNTTFAQLATQLPADALTNTAKQLGLGVDFVLPGITTVTGSVPAATSTVERAEDGFGQGKVVASPFGMAVLASTVASGAMPSPTLLRGTPTKADTQPSAVPGPVLDAVRAMMREVVTDGTAKPLQPFGDVRGKTGTAQFGDGTHAHGWFVGYRGDLAFAVLVVDAGGSGEAVQATARFLTALG